MSCPRSELISFWMQVSSYRYSILPGDGIIVLRNYIPCLMVVKQMSVTQFLYDFWQFGHVILLGDRGELAKVWQIACDLTAVE